MTDHIQNTLADAYRHLGITDTKEAEITYAFVELADVQPPMSPY